MNEKISIIVPVYNAESTLERCVSALTEQTYQNIEIILVNDGSRDCSLEICRRYAAEDARVVVIDKPNGGVSSARNAGLDAATGEFVMFCDSDDWAEPEWCWELISHYEDGCLVMCGHYVEGKQPYLPHEIRAEQGIARYARRDFFRLKLANFYAPWNKIYSRAVIERAKLRFHQKLTNGEDYLFILQYLNRIPGSIVFLDRCVFHYQWPREYSLSSRVPGNYFEQCCILTNAVLELCDSLGIGPGPGRMTILTDRYNEFQKVILSILGDQGISNINAIRKITEVMSAPEYQLCAAEANIAPNKIYCWLARRKWGFGLWLWHKIRKR